MTRRWLVALVCVLLLPIAAASAQVPGTLTQQSPERLDAVTQVGTSVTSAATITIAVPSGQYAYITNVEITNCAGSAAVTAAAVTSVTTTNLRGATWTVGSGATAGLCQPSPGNTSFPLGLKSAAPGTDVTVVLPTFATNQSIRVSVYYYVAP